MQSALEYAREPYRPMPTDPAESHRDLLGRVASARDKEAFAELFAHFAPRIKSMMLRAGASAAQAEDLAQEAMLTMWRKAALYSPEKGAVSTWMFTIARNLRIDRLRLQSSQPHQDVDDLELVGEERGGEEVTLEAEIVSRVSAAIATLPVDQRAVIELSYVEDIAHSEISERLGIPVGTVKSRLRLAYEKLRVELENLK